MTADARSRLNAWLQEYAGHLLTGTAIQKLEDMTRLNYDEMVKIRIEAVDESLGNALRKRVEDVIK